ncbi:TRAP transporter small permease [Alloalcanivorax mobilis]|uniref:TRAP transporter small permease n=1 Tax=Alloalcanivorax mobilis TaxID=2019569 RepID=UPI000C773F78|nr:TRAP transporter small permease [Alloalcanivorax mobilis]
MLVIEKLFRGLTDALGAAALIALAFLMFAITVDVSVRAITGQPISGIFELSEIALVLIVFLGLGWTQRDNAHIRVDALVNLAPAALARAMNAFSWFAAALALGLLAWPSTIDAAHSFEIREFRWGSIQFPIWWAKIILAAGLWFATVQMVLYGLLALIGRVPTRADGAVTVQEKRHG